MIKQTVATLIVSISTVTVAAQSPRPLLQIPFENSAEYAQLRKPVLASRVIEDNSSPANWKLTGAASLSFPAEAGPGGMKTVRVEMKMFPDSGAPPRTRLAAMNLAHTIPGEDWTGYNRISMWIKPDISGFPTMPIQLVLHSAGAQKTPDKYGREGMHLITFAKNEWQHVVWEIDAYPRDKVTLLEFGYFINKLLPASTDRIAFQIGRIDLERVVPDKHTGWDVAAGKVSFSNTGYQVGASKTAIASGLSASDFELLRIDHTALGSVVLHKPVTSVKSRLGEFQVLDFSEVNTPGRYVLRTGNTYTESFGISDTVWKTTIWKSLNFLYAQRCGFDVPGVHGIDHLDWFATLGDQKITMSGGWHDAGDLSQGLINTGEITYALFALAETFEKRGDDPALLDRVLEEARWGLDWVTRVRFPGGYRMGFTNHNFWSNNVVGDADDRTRETKNNPNVNYIAASAEAIAHRVLLRRDPAMAAKALQLAEEDWSYAIVGVEGPSTWHTPAFSASRVELAGIGITASIELYRETGRQKYADKAIELARVVMASQQRKNVGSIFPLNGFFYTGPDKDTLFHEFHRGNDQAAIVGLTQLIRALPTHPDRKQWLATVTDFAEYQKRTASTTAPYHVLPNYVYRVGDEKEVADSAALHNATKEDYRAQVLQGMPMGDGWYLRTFPVWFARRGNFGILLSQAKALSAVALLRSDSAGMDLAQQQAQWIVGRNPFSQSTMYGEGYGWSQQYSVSSGDFVGSLIVGMQSAGNSDLPYWSSGNMFVWKEVWVHSTARWLWLMADLMQS